MQEIYFIKPMIRTKGFLLYIFTIEGFDKINLLFILSDACKNYLFIILTIHNFLTQYNNFT